MRCFKYFRRESKMINSNRSGIKWLIATGVAMALCCLLFITCTKIPPEPVLKTRLMITLGDDEGKSVDSTIVKLFRKSDSTLVEERMSDSTGVLYYTDLQPILYYWTAEKGCKNIRASQTTLNKPLIEGAIMYGYSILSNRATLHIINTSQNSYTISDSTMTFTLPKDTAMFVYPKIGSHIFKSTASDTLVKIKDSTLSFACGDTVFIKYPF